MPSSATRVIQENLADVQCQVADACGRSGRDTAEVRLVAVTKYAEWEWIEALSKLHSDFGENRPQQLAERHQLLPEIHWHLIGQLQRNKVRLALEHASLIHSVDSLRLLNRIAAVAEEMQSRPEVLLQVNISGESSKSGFSATQLLNDWQSVITCSGAVQIKGLMTMAPDSEDPEDARPVFAGLRVLRDELAERSDSVSAGLQIPELSMGMSSDFVTAVEEGATLIRLGSRLFSGLS